MPRPRGSGSGADRPEPGSEPKLEACPQDACRPARRHRKRSGGRETHRAHSGEDGRRIGIEYGLPRSRDNLPRSRDKRPIQIASDGDRRAGSVSADDQMGLGPCRFATRGKHAAGNDIDRQRLARHRTMAERPPNGCVRPGAAGGQRRANTDDDIIRFRRTAPSPDPSRDFAARTDADLGCRSVAKRTGDGFALESKSREIICRIRLPGPRTAPIAASRSSKIYRGPTAPVGPRPPP